MNESSQSIDAATVAESSGALRYDRIVDLSDPNTAHAKLVAMCGEGKRVLEIGPSTGYLSQVLQARGCTVTGIEIDPAAARIAATRCDRIIVADIETLDSARCLAGEQFDVIMFGDVLEHLVEPEEVLRKVAPLLAPGGFVLASIPNVAHASVRLALLIGRFQYTELGLLDRTHLRFFDRTAVEAMFTNAGYKIGDWNRVTVDPEQTEVHVPWDSIPPTLREAVVSAPEAKTYQFVVKAHAASEWEKAAPPENIEARLDQLWDLEANVVESERQKAEALATAEGALSAEQDARERAARVQRELRGVLDSRTVRATMLVRPFLDLIRRLFRRQTAAPRVEGSVEEMEVTRDGRIRIAGWCWSNTVRRPRLALFVDGARERVWRPRLQRPELTGDLGLRRPVVGFDFEDAVETTGRSTMKVAVIFPLYLVLEEREVSALVARASTGQGKG